MMQLNQFLLALAIILPTHSTTRADESPAITPGDINAAVVRSLPYIAKRGQWWIDSKDCVSCHRTAFTIWTHAAAADAGVPVDAEQLNQWVDWSFEALLKKNDKDTIVATANLDGVAQILHVTNSLPLTAMQKEHRQKLLAYLTDGQTESGAWKPAGQLPMQKRPASETKYVTTSWNRWLAVGSGLNDATNSKALEFLAQPIEFASTESLVVDVLNAGSDDDRAAAFHLIAAEQNEDGGFGWLRKGESDAIATGQVLFAAASLNDTKPFANVLNKAISFLLTTQEENGSWKVKGTKKNRQAKIQETATYWGTCWAVIGMLELQKSRDAALAQR